MWLDSHSQFYANTQAATTTDEVDRDISIRVVKATQRMKLEKKESFRKRKLSVRAQVVLARVKRNWTDLSQALANLDSG